MFYPLKQVVPKTEPILNSDPSRKTASSQIIKKINNRPQPTPAWAVSEAQEDEADGKTLSVDLRLPRPVTVTVFKSPTSGPA